MRISRLNTMKYLLLMTVFIIISAGSLAAVSSIFKEGVEIRKLPISWVLILSSMTVIYIFLDGLRFYVILKTLGIDLPYLYVVKQAVIGVFVANVTPFLAGGSIAQIYFMHEKEVPMSDAAAATALKAMLASGFFFMTLPIVLFLNPTILLELNIETIGWLPWLSVAFVLGIFAVIKISKFKEVTIRYVERLLLKFPLGEHRRGRLIEEIYEFLNTINLFLTGNKLHLFMSFMFTIIHFLFLFSFSVVILKLFGYKIKALTVISGQMLSNFIMYFGFTPGASGFAEGGFAYFFSMLVNEEDLLQIVLLWRGATVYLGMLIGFIFFIRESLNVRKSHHKT